MIDIQPMQIGSIPDTDLPRYCENDQWWFEQKIDGHRKLAIIEDGRVRVLNKKGIPADLPAAVTAELATMTNGPWVLDGELLGGVFWVFDLPMAGQFVRPAQGYEQRRDVLERLFEIWGRGRRHVRLVPCARSHVEKASLAKRVLEEHGEGVVLKHRAGAYLCGRESRDVLKAKFRHDIDCVVTRLRVGGKDNFAVAVYDGTERVEVAVVTAGAGDGWKVKVGDVVCVRYQHASLDRKLVQPTLPKLRDDKSPEECTVDQLVYVNKEVLV